MVYHGRSPGVQRRAHRRNCRAVCRYSTPGPAVVALGQWLLDAWKLETRAATR